MSVAEGIQRAFQLFSVINQQKLQQGRYAQAERRLELEEEFRRADLEFKRMTQTRQEKTAAAREKRADLAEELRAFEKGFVPLDEEQAAGRSSIELGPGLATTEQGRSIKTGSGRTFYPLTFGENLRLEAEKQEALRQVELPEAGAKTVDVRALPFMTSEANRQASAQRTQQQITSREATVEKTLTSREAIAKAGRESAEKRAGMRAGRSTAEDRRAATARQIEEAAQRVIADNERGQGPPENAVRNAEVYYTDDPVIRLNRDKVVKRVKQMLQLKGGKDAAEAEADRITSGGGPTPKKKATKADVARFAKQNGIPYEQALAEAKRAGWEVQ